MRALALLLACGFVLAACGGGDGSGDRDAEAEIRKVIMDLATSDDPAECRELVTPRLLEQMQKTSYEVALETCEALTVHPLLEDPEKVTISRIDVEGDSAVAVITSVGSILDGQTVRYGFVERDGRWKQDEFIGFVDLDEEKLATEWGRLQMLLATTPQETEAAICVMNRLLKMDGADLEEMYLGEDPDPIIELAQACASRSSAL